MELIRGIHNLRSHHAGCVLTIGKFDGVHLGHQAVLSNVKQHAAKLGLPATVMVFEPQPEELFSPDSAPARLSPLREKYQKLAALGVDRLLCVRFTKEFAQLSAEQFVDELIVKQLGVKYLVVGDDFRFGKMRKGDFDMLKVQGNAKGFDVASTQSFRMHECRISSTAIRQALAEGNMPLAEQMLGMPFYIEGKVVHGEKKGRTIGFPTANVLLNRFNAPIGGVFAVKASVEGQELTGVANVGYRPTLNGQHMQLEVHFFDYDGDLYGKPIRVFPVKKIRNEMKFASFEALKQQIEQDALVARQLFAE